MDDCKNYFVIKEDVLIECSNKYAIAVEIPCGVKEIGNSAFSDCEKLESIDIPGSVKKIGKCAFWNCKSLKSILIPHSVEEIGDYAFEYTGLTSVTIPKSVKEIGNVIFWDCNSLNRIKYGDKEFVTHEENGFHHSATYEFHHKYSNKDFSNQSE